MKWSCGALVCCLIACGTVPNPRSCRDGLCTDQQFPFCDIDGALAGAPETCISVACSAGELAACRDDRAIVCNASGNDYDLVDCPHGCGADGCLPPEVNECTTNAQCTNPLPICSAEMVCIGCTSDEQCESKVCQRETGACIAVSEVVYAAPTGATGASCVEADPCSLPRAVELASQNPLRQWVRLSPGDYSSDVQLASGTVQMIGMGARILGAAVSGTETLVIGMGGKLTIRDVTLDLARGGVACGGVGAGAFFLGGELHLRDLEVEAVYGNSLRLFNGCTAFLERTFVRGSELDSIPIMVGRSGGGAGTANLTADRLRVETIDQPLSVVVSLQGAESTITNSLFVGCTVTLNNGKFAFNTVIASQAPALYGGAAARLENNIVLAQGQTNAVGCDSCTSRANVVFPQMMTIPGTIVMDPKFVDIAAKNFTLQSTSPARDAALPQPDLTTDHDFDGRMRPQGSAHDIGAFERP